jgi:hypothetical protein
MRPSERLAAAIVMLALSLSFAPRLTAQAGPMGAPGDKVAPPGFPEIGLWMIARDGKVADWLGYPHQGRKLLEPINVLIVDPFAVSASDAASRLQAAVEKAEFELREGHSSGYSGLIGGSVYYQTPPGSEETFSDAPFTISNNHGRIFGPMEWEGAYLFTGAFSRESVDLITKVKHQYVSFDRARDAFTQKMSAKTEYRLSSFVYLGNAIPADDALTTGDHDGMAAVLRAIR